MIRKFLKYLIVNLLYLPLKIRYQLDIVGLENLEEKKLLEKGKLLFLSNHPVVLVDAILVAKACLLKYNLRPLPIDYVYYIPIVNIFLKIFRCIPLASSKLNNPKVKRQKNAQTVKLVADALHSGENFLLFPTGNPKSTAKETLGNISGVYRILSQVPECQIVLVRVKGMWGSSFSRYNRKRGTKLYKTILQAIKFAFQNLIFFMPRRKVIIEFEIAPKNFPLYEDMETLNQWLENWYNRPDGLTKQEGAYPGDSLIKVSYCFWKEKYL